MKSLTYIIGIILFVITAHSCNQIDGNGNIIEKVVEISDYNDLKIAGAADIVYEQKQDTLPYLHIEIDENLFPLLDIESKNGELSIKPVEGNSLNPTKFIIHTNSKELSSLSMAGSGEMQLTGTLRSESLYIKSAGSTTIKSDSIISNNIKIECAGSGDISLRGKTKSVECEVAGSADLNIVELEAENVKCNIAGSADITTYAEKTLDINVAGSGKISYKGSPEITKKIAGSGEIVSLD